MRETPDIETSSANYATRFAGPAGEYFLNIQETAIKDVLDAPFGSTILDVGGGHGQLAPMLATRGCKVTVVGSSNVCHTRLLESARNVPLAYVTADLLHLPFEDRSFDLVISVRLISHVQAWHGLIAEFCRVARNTVVIDYPNLVSINVLTPMMFRLKKRIEGNTRTYTSFNRRRLSVEFGKHDFHTTTARAQFLLPMVVHRAFANVSYFRTIERVCSATKLTQLLGSPVILRADRSTVHEKT